jgi:hypothetical protein
MNGEPQYLHLEMGKRTPPPQDFKIHVDPSCLTDSTDLQMSPERVTSNQTVVHHDSWSEQSPGQKPAEEKTEEHDKDQEERERQIDHIEAQIKAAAQAVVASIEKGSYGGNQDSELSMRTDDSYEGEGTELTYDGTESSYVGGTEMKFESESGDHSELRSGIDGTETSYDTQDERHSEHGDIEGGTEATYESENEDNSELHQSIEGTKATYESENKHHSEKGEVQDTTIAKHESENEHHSDNDRGGDSSSHHDGDIDDDVFSRNSGHSARSSLNSSDDLHVSDDAYEQKALTSPAVGEEAASSHEDEVVSRIPSAASYMHPMPDAERTPSKVLSRPPFRTPSSVRAMQMSSPTASIFSSPRSTKRMSTVSRIGTPSSHTSKNRTPTRFKAKKEYPLVLLHATVLPLQWPYSHLMSSPELPESLQKVKESWRLLQQKLGEAVLERGILLPHPQDSYEVLEERLLEALELPCRPRALILKCGHYMGPHDIETPSSDEEGGDYWGRDKETRRRWCDICRREVRLEDISDVQGKRFTIKTYASNGLMRAGAWAAVWKEMERVDVEIEPYIEPSQHAELEKLATVTRHATPVREEQHDDGFVDEEVMVENEHEHDREIEHEPQPEHVESAPEEHIDADEQRRMDEAELNKILEEERMREIYGHSPPIVEEREQERPQPSRRSSSRASVNEDSLPELLLAAFKVAMRDRKNVAIAILSVLVLMLALRPRPVVNEPQILSSSNVPEILSDGGRKQAVEVGREAAQSVVEAMVEKPVQIIEKAPVAADVVEEKLPEPTALVDEVQKKTAEVFESIRKEVPSSADENTEVPVETKAEAATESIEEPTQNVLSPIKQPPAEAPEIEQMS